MINEIVSVPNKIKLCMLTESKNKRLGGFPTLFISFNKNVKHLERTNERAWFLKVALKLKTFWNRNILQHLCGSDNLASDFAGYYL